MNNLGGKISIVVIATHTNQYTMLEKQVKSIRFAFPKSEVVFVVGPSADKSIKLITENDPLVKIVENENYEHTSQYRSAILGLRICSNENIILINGNGFIRDLNKYVLGCNKFKGSKIFAQKTINKNDSRIGITMDDDRNTVHLDYDIDNKWKDAILLESKELQLFKKYWDDHVKRKFLLHEIINMIIQNGGQFKCVQVKS